ncbi:hypothetical protein AAC387_Pa07g1333 [Persea americana]
MSFYLRQEVQECICGRCPVEAKNPTNIYSFKWVERSRGVERSGLERKSPLSGSIWVSIHLRMPVVADPSLLDGPVVEGNPHIGSVHRRCRTLHTLNEGRYRALKKG